MGIAWWKTNPGTSQGTTNTLSGTQSPSLLNLKNSASSSGYLYETGRQ